MKENKKDEKIIFSVTVGELQQEAVRRIGRNLTEEELYKASKGVESGLSFGIETVFKTVIEESIK